MRLESNWPRALVAVLWLTPALVALPGGGDTERVSVSSAGSEANWPSSVPACCADGRFVAFHSSATNLVSGDTNFSTDVFVHDRETGWTTRVSVSSSGVQGNHHSSDPAISADGRYVVFSSRASNLVGGDSNGFEDIFLHDRTTGTTTRVSLGLAGVQSSGWSTDCDITPDGSSVCFTSAAANLVAGDTNGSSDVFVRHLATGTTTRVSVSSSGTEGDGSSRFGVIAANGQVVAFDSFATDLVVVDTNGDQDVFVHDLATGQTTRVSESTAGAEGNSDSRFPAMSLDGRYVAFQSLASTLVANDLNLVDDVFLHDRQTGATSIVSVDSNGVQGDFFSYRPSLTADGRCVAFDSWASNLVTGDTNSKIDVFVHDTLTQVTRRVSLGSAGQESNNHSSYVDISADGSFVAFESDATNLVPGITNGWTDVFARELLGATSVVYCTAGSSASGCTAQLCATGMASATAPSGFTLDAAGVEGQKDGLFFFSTHGRQANSWGNGTSFQCVVPPVKRAGLLTGTGTPGACDGSLFQDLNALWCPTCPRPLHNPGAGALVQAQLWYRDPFNTSNQTTSLSNAIEFPVVP